RAGGADTALHRSADVGLGSTGIDEQDEAFQRRPRAMPAQPPAAGGDRQQQRNQQQSGSGSHFTTRLTSRFGTTITRTSCLPSRKRATFGSALARASIVA